MLALLGHNIEEIRPLVALRALVLSLLAGVLLYALLRLLLKDGLRAALVASVILVLFFTYGHVYAFLEPLQPLGFSPGRHRFLLPLWLLLFVSGIRWALRRRDLSGLTQGLNTISAVVLLFPLAQIALFGLRSLQASQVVQAQQAPFELQLPQDPPDIYYIVLDAYARDDILRQDLGLDNRPFLDELRELGFYIAPCSQSNYAQTQLSLTSSLNFTYLPDLSPEFQPGQTSRAGVAEFLRHNRARQALEGLGYTVIAFETGFKVTEWEDADIFLTRPSNPYGELQVLEGMNDFEVLFLRSTAGLALIDATALLPQFIQQDLENPSRIHYERIRYGLDELKRMPERSGPKFVFAHLVSPHPPFVFNAQGEFEVTDQDDLEGYRQQIRFLNREIIPILQTLIEQSDTPPVILLQADHGAIHMPPGKRMAILNAYYLPRGGQDLLYENISPVNSFRLIFDYYFGGNFGLLEDGSYFSSYQQPFDFTLIKDPRADCAPE